MKRLVNVFVFVCLFVGLAFGADQKITQLTGLTTMSADDLFVVVDSPASSPATKKITKSNLFATLDSVNITGTATIGAISIPTYTDLQVYMDTAQVLSSSQTTLEYSSEIVDSLNEFNTTTHIFTAQNDGFYEISARWGITNEALVAAGAVQITPIAPWGPSSYLVSDWPRIGTNQWFILTSMSFRLTAGDQVFIKGAIGSAATSETLTGEAYSLRIKRIH